MAHCTTEFAIPSTEECPICLMEVHSIKVLPCSHELCKLCVEKLSESKDNFNCPLCRQSIGDFDSLTTKYYGSIQCSMCQNLKEPDEFFWCSDCAKIVCCRCLAKEHGFDRNHKLKEWNTKEAYLSCFQSLYITTSTNKDRVKKVIRHILEPALDRVVEKIEENQSFYSGSVKDLAHRYGVSHLLCDNDDVTPKAKTSDVNKELFKTLSIACRGADNPDIPEIGEPIGIQNMDKVADVLLEEIIYSSAEPRIVAKDISTQIIVESARRGGGHGAIVFSQATEDPSKCWDVRRISTNDPEVTLIDAALDGVDGIHLIVKERDKWFYCYDSVYVYPHWTLINSQREEHSTIVDARVCCTLTGTPNVFLVYKTSQKSSSVLFCFVSSIYASQRYDRAFPAYEQLGVSIKSTSAIRISQQEAWVFGADDKGIHIFLKKKQSNAGFFNINRMKYISKPSALLCSSGKLNNTIVVFESSNTSGSEKPSVKFYGMGENFDFTVYYTKDQSGDVCSAGVQQRQLKTAVIVHGDGTYYCVLVQAGSYSNNNGWQVISDTGTSLLAGPQSIVSSIAQALGGQYNSQYGLVTSSSCALGIQGFGGGGPQWILGDVFIRQFCNIYDVGNQRVGFMAATQ